MSYPAIHEPRTNKEAISFLQDAMNYIGRNYGGTLAHHLLAVSVQRIRREDDRNPDPGSIDILQLVRSQQLCSSCGLDLSRFNDHSKCREREGTPRPQQFFRYIPADSAIN